MEGAGQALDFLSAFFNPLEALQSPTCLPPVPTARPADNLHAFRRQLPPSHPDYIPATVRNASSVDEWGNVCFGGAVVHTTHCWHAWSRRCPGRPTPVPRRARADAGTSASSPCAPRGAPSGVGCLHGAVRDGSGCQGRRVRRAASSRPRAPRSAARPASQAVRPLHRRRLASAGPGAARWRRSLPLSRRAHWCC